MTPKEKAEELYNKYGSMLAKDHNFRSIKAIKKCVILAVDEVFNSMPLYPYNGGYYETITDRAEEVAQYWLNVKKELEKL